MFKKDYFLIGLLAGIIFPVICFGILYGSICFLGNYFESLQSYPMTKLMFAGVALNVLPARYFYVRMGLAKTAMGVLLSTVVLIITVLLSF